eukprot:TRINITY_DN12901_c0_g1_i3.p1 TRINITY_DN12901_c0_g1~~TRINITY_DN12901_c0_g1_i3.p1  ORF type:complete len:378 (-),score=76.34 TRINITY_DN12901_c0_g1_i3:114-1187(-)
MCIRDRWYQRRVHGEKVYRLFASEMKPWTQSKTYGEFYSIEAIYPKEKLTPTLEMNGLLKGEDLSQVNVILHILFQVPALTDFLRKLSRVEGDVLTEFVRLLKSTKNPENALLLKRLMERGFAAFKGTRKPDAYICLQELLETIHASLNHAPRPTQALPKDEADYSRWAVIQKGKDASIIYDIFAGHLARDTICQACGSRYRSFEVCFGITLPIPPTPRTFEKAHSMEEMLRNQLGETVVEQYPCARCRRPCRAVQKKTLLKHPNVLMIHYQRFDMTAKRKREDPIINKTSYLELSGVNYNLFAVVLHIGDFNNGEFHAFVKPLHKGWFLCNNERISAVEDVPKDFANYYILFYTRA